MNRMKMGKKLLSLVLAAVLLLSVLCVTALAADSVDEAKASLADVKITQTYTGKTTKTADNVEHDYRKDGKDVSVPAGNMVLYQPKQEQHYYFLGADHSQYWFVHFTGRQVKNILKRYGIPLDGYIIRTGISYEYEDLFRKMRDELTECSWGYEEILTYHLRELLITMNRRIHEQIPKITGFVQDEIDHAKTYFREHYNEDISIEAYSASRNMSTSWFSRCFRSAVGESPMRYILLLRIRNAQVLLETTDGTVSEIARIVGYENPMYFSRIFRKEKGMSPLKYRKSFRAGLAGQGAAVPDSAE